jgi:hypothetical protein
MRSSRTTCICPHMPCCVFTHRCLSAPYLVVEYDLPPHPCHQLQGFKVAAGQAGATRHHQQRGLQRMQGAQDKAYRAPGSYCGSMGKHRSCRRRGCLELVLACARSCCAVLSCVLSFPCDLLPQTSHLVRRGWAVSPLPGGEQAADATCGWGHVVHPAVPCLASSKIHKVLLCVCVKQCIGLCGMLVTAGACWVWVSPGARMPCV